jgi:hypothetical protein
MRFFDKCIEKALEKCIIVAFFRQSQKKSAQNAQTVQIWLCFANVKNRK